MEQKKTHENLCAQNQTVIWGQGEFWNVSYPLEVAAQLDKNLLWKQNALSRALNRTQRQTHTGKKTGSYAYKAPSLPLFLALLLLSLNSWTVHNGKWVSCAFATQTAQVLRSWGKMCRVRAPRVMHFCNGQVGSDWWKLGTKLLSNSWVMTLERGGEVYSSVSLTFLQVGSTYGISRG